MHLRLIGALWVMSISFVACFLPRANTPSSPWGKSTVAQFAESSGSEKGPSLGYTLKERNPYDVHVYYSTPQEKEEAMRLREQMQAQFSSWMRFYPPKDRPIGPHPVPMWEADFGSYENRHRLSEICDFLEQERGESLSILIHPHSTDTDYQDHTRNAIWFGTKQDLRLGGWPQ